MDGTIVVLDWDTRAPLDRHYRLTAAHYLFDSLETERLVALIDQSDVIIGIDSGPIHLAGLTETPAVAVMKKGHYPSTYMLPREETLSLVASTNEWNRWKRLAFNILEQRSDHLTMDFVADANSNAPITPATIHR